MNYPTAFWAAATARLIGMEMKTYLFLTLIAVILTAANIRFDWRRNAQPNKAEKAA